MDKKTESSASRRQQILGEEEVESIYERPRFTYGERLLYFSLTAPEKQALEQFHTFSSRTFYILQLGYFKARQQFFTLTLREVLADASYVQHTYSPNFPLTELGIAKGTRLKQQQVILDLFRYRLCRRREQRQLARRAEQSARISSKSIYVLRNLPQYLAEQRIVAPDHTVL